MKVVTGSPQLKQQQQFKQIPLNLARPLSTDDDDPQIEAYRKRLLLQNNKLYSNIGMQKQQSNKLNGIQKLQSTGFSNYNGQGISEINQQSQDTKIMHNNISAKIDDQIKMNYRVKPVQIPKYNQQNQKSMKTSESSQNIPKINQNVNQTEILLQNGNNLVKTLQQATVKIENTNLGSMNDNLNNMQLNSGVKMSNSNGQVINSSQNHSGQNKGNIRYSRKEYLQNFANRNIMVFKQQDNQENKQAPIVSTVVQNIQKQDNIDKSEILKEYQTDMTNAFQTEYSISKSLITNIKNQQPRDKINMQSSNVSNALNLLIINAQTPQKQTKNTNHMNNNIFSKQLYGQQSPTIQGNKQSIIPQIPVRLHSIKPSASREQITSSANNVRFDDQNRQLIQNNFQTYNNLKTQNRKYSLNNLNRQNTNYSNKSITTNRNLSIRKAR